MQSWLPSLKGCRCKAQSLTVSDKEAQYSRQQADFFAHRIAHQYEKHRQEELRNRLLVRERAAKNGKNLAAFKPINANPYLIVDEPEPPLSQTKAFGSEFSWLFDAAEEEKLLRKDQVEYELIPNEQLLLKRVW